MKKILALVLALCLLCGGVALADDTTITDKSDNQTASTTVSYNIATNETYTVTIPSSVTLTGTDSLNGTLPIGLKTDKFNVSGKTIAVKLTNTANNFNLTSGENKIPYSLKASGVTCKVNDTLLSWTYGQSTDQTLTLDAQATVSAALPAGEYTDTLTFTVSVDSSGVSTGGVTVNPWENGTIIGGEAIETD